MRRHSISHRIPAAAAAAENQILTLRLSLTLI